MNQLTKLPDKDYKTIKILIKIKLQITNEFFWNKWKIEKYLINGTIYKNNEKEILQLKNATPKLLNLLVWLNSKVTMPTDRISELEDKLIQFHQSAKAENRLEKTMKRFLVTCDTLIKDPIFTTLGFQKNRTVKLKELLWLHIYHKEIHRYKKQSKPQTW